MAEQEAAATFKQWIADQGSVPKHCLHKIPDPKTTDSWGWNRMLDDKKYRGPTCRPINRFTWKFEDDGSIAITNHISRMMQDVEDEVSARVLADAEPSIDGQASCCTVS
mmetsp:Transcript_115780/g.216721  ORF Transcript_115780/g.216721 Transcript_115780/m.216721 type:complete len:109 (-) Transcript_115780:133-459(-)